MTRERPITTADLAGLPGLRGESRARILERQPSTVFEVLCIRAVGRATTRAFLKRGLVTDPENVQLRSLARDELLAVNYGSP
jgi:hypothetical protein